MSEADHGHCWQAFAWHETDLRAIQFLGQAPPFWGCHKHPCGVIVTVGSTIQDIPRCEGTPCTYESHFPQ